MDLARAEYDLTPAVAPDAIEGADGSVTIDLDPQPTAALPTGVHDDNLARALSAEVRNRIASELLEHIEDDISSAADYHASYIKGIDLLGLKIEEAKTFPFKNACGVWDPLLAEAVIRFQANARGELLPAAGPVKTQVIGASSEETAAKAERVKEWMNYYLTQVAEEYYSDRDQMLFWLPLAGSTFVKVYQDPYLERPVAPFITPDQFIVAYTTTDLATCPRMTHALPMNKRDFIWRKLNGVYFDDGVGEPQDTAEITPTKEKIDETQGLAQVIGRWDAQYTILESHVDLDIPGLEHLDQDGKPSGYPLPYIVTLEGKSRKLIAIRRNWREGDPKYHRRNYFIQYKFLPGLGFYGLGLSNVLGGYARASTQITRILIDAGILASFPGGFRAAGTKLEAGTLSIGPNQFPELNTNGLPIGQVFTTLPYKEPSEVLRELRNDISEGARRLGSTTEIAVGEGRQDAPVGTTVALMEAATKVESGVIKRLYVSQGREFRLLAGLFGEVLPERPYPFAVRGKSLQIMRADFAPSVDVIPVGDPNVPSSAQRTIRAEAVLRTAGAFPEEVNKKEALRRLFTAMGEEDIESLIVSPAQARPMDPVSENQVALAGGPLTTAPWQDHDSHITIHLGIIDAAPSIQAHIAEHLGQKFRAVVEQAIGQPLPPLGEQIPPEVENQIAFMVAGVMDAVKEDMAGADGQMNPMALALADIKVKSEAVKAKMADSKLDASVKAFSAWLAHVDREGASQTKLRMASMGNQTQLQIARMKPVTMPKSRGKK